MKRHRLGMFFMLALATGLPLSAQTAAGVPGVFPNTNIIRSFPQLSFAQGTCNDGTHTYWFGTAGEAQRTAEYVNTGLYGKSPTNGMGDFGGCHLGDPDYYGGYIYSPLEAAVGAPPGAANIDVAVFNATNLARCAAISISNHQSEVSAVCIAPAFSNSVALFATSWAAASTNDGIFEYRVSQVTNLVFVRALPLSQAIREMQGIVCVGGMLYVMADKGPAGEIYQVNPTNGNVVHLAEVNMPGETEWEGLDYFHGFLVANEGGTGTANWFDFFGVVSNGAGGKAK